MAADRAGPSSPEVHFPWLTTQQPPYADNFASNIHQFLGTHGKPVPLQLQLMRAWIGETA